MITYGYTKDTISIIVNQNQDFLFTKYNDNNVPESHTYNLGLKLGNLLFNDHLSNSTLIMYSGALPIQNLQTRNNLDNFSKCYR